MKKKNQTPKLFLKKIRIASLIAQETAMIKGAM